MILCEDSNEIELLLQFFFKNLSAKGKKRKLLLPRGGYSKFKSSYRNYVTML